MKKVTIVFAAMCFFACSFLLIIQPVSASTAWTRTDVKDSTLFNPIAMFHFDTSGSIVPGAPLTGTIGIFDLSSPVTSANSLTLLSGSTVSQNFYTYQDSFSAWFAAKTNSSDAPLSLNSNQFGFYYKPDDTTGYLTDYTITPLEEENNFGLTWAVPYGNGVPSYVSILANDVTSVPVPTALLLLSSGILGLLGFKRRIKNI